MNNPLTQKLDEIFQPWSRDGAPGVIAAVSHKGEVIYRRAFGLASIEHGKPNAPEIRSRIGSTTKQFCCMGILLLAEEGKLDINQPVRTCLPELSNVSGEPTLLQLMQHRGGLRDPMFTAFIVNGGNYGHLPAGGSLDLMSRYTERNFAPGERMAYSNSGYTLLSLVIERLSGQTLEQFFTERIFKPVGMKDTALLRSDLDIVPNVTTLYLPQPEGKWRRGIYPTDELLGSGGLISTVDDMLLWAAQLRAPQRKVGSAKTWSLMLERQTYRSGQRAGYCLGVAQERYRGVDTLHHAGATLGSQSQTLTVPQHELDIAILSNRMDGPAGALALKVIDVVLENVGLEPPLVPSAAADYPAMRGRWYSAQSRTLMSVTAKLLKPNLPELLLLSLYNSPVTVLNKQGEGLAMPDGAMSSFEIRKLPAGDAPPAVLDVHITGEPERFERLPDTPPTAAELAPAVTGRYRYVEFGKEVELVLRDDGKLYLDFLPYYGYSRWEIEPCSADVLACGTLHSVPVFPLPMPATITLERGAGKVTGFWLDMDRVRGVRFDRI